MEKRNQLEDDLKERKYYIVVSVCVCVCEKLALEEVMDLSYHILLNNEWGYEMFRNV